MFQLLSGGIALITVYILTMATFVTLLGDTSIGNFTWGGGVMLLGLYTLFMKGTFEPRQLLITGLMVAWALRLIIYVYQRYNGKDPRFLSWKHSGLKGFIFNIAFMLGLELVLMLIMAWPVVLVNSTHGPALGFVDYCAVSLWLFGFVFEAVSDYQLFDFIKNPASKGHVMRYGLWRYSRHPNYFGEVVMWWAVFLIAYCVPYGLTTIIAPATITFLLIFVTGVPLIEQAMASNLEYQAYKKETSMFIPWFRK